jgi:hypothetical protein
VGRGKEMRLSKSVMNLEESSDQQGVLKGKEDQKRIMMIGGIKVFLPYSLVEAREDVVGAATVEGQPAVIVKEMEKILEVAQGKEEEHIVETLTPWKRELEMLEDWLNHPDPIDDCHEETVIQMLVDENSKESLRIFIQGDE